MKKRTGRASIVILLFLFAFVSISARAAGVSVALDPGWNLVESQIAQNLSGKICGGVVPNNAKQAVYKQNGNVACDDVSMFERGMGYWVYTDTASTFDFNETQPPLTTVNVRIFAGWNLIGNPFPQKTLSFSDIFVDGQPWGDSSPVRKQLWAFDPASGKYNPVKEMEPGRAYAVYSSAAAQMTLVLGTQTPPTPSPADQTVETRGNTSFIAGEILLMIPSGTDPQALYKLLNGQEISQVSEIGLYKVKVADAWSALSVIARLKNKDFKNVGYSLNYVMTPSTYLPADPPYQAGGDATQVWGFEKIHAPDVWRTFSAAANPVVAVVDTGVAASHPDLAGRVLAGASMISGASAQSDPTGHGTRVAGIIAAVPDNGAGLAGVCMDCNILPVRVCTDNGQCPLYAVLNGIVYAANNARVINVSLSSRMTGAADPARDVFKSVVDYATARNALVVVSAGNENVTTTTILPASVPGVLTVGATDEADQSTNFTNYGAEVKIAAPGQSIYSTDAPAAYGKSNGTSMSAGFVSGAAGLLISAAPSLTPAQISDYLVKSADPIVTVVPVGPRLNLYKAMQLVGPMLPAFQIVSLTPQNVQANSGDTVQFVAVTSVAGNVGVTFNWTATGGTIQDLGGGKASWTAPASGGTYTVSVSALDAFSYTDTESSNVIVTAGQTQPVPTTITITPDFVTLVPGQIQDFTAEVRSQTGDLMNVPLTWSMSPDIAVLIADGEIQATSVGTGTLTVDAGSGLFATAAINIIVNTNPLFPVACAAGCTQCVTSTGWGAGSLKKAIENANSAAGHDIICFDAGLAGPITPTTPGVLPSPTDDAGLTLDMTTDVGGREFILADAPGGWKICSNNNVIKGFSIYGMVAVNNYALSIDGSCGNASNNTISNMNIGTRIGDPGGLATNYNGILITGGADFNTVSNNYIINSAQAAVLINGNSNNNTISNNTIGTNRAGTGVAVQTNLSDGISITGGANNNAISNNLISGNAGDGVDISGANSNTLKGNKIGTDTTGLNSIANTGWGVNISAGASSNIIGTTTAGEGNTIAYNTGGGVTVNGTANNDRVLGNSIFLNTGLSLDLVAGGNGGIAAPTLVNYVATGPGIYTVNGTGTVGYTVDVYQTTNAAAPAVPVDPSGFGEMFKYLCSAVVDGSGNYSALNCPSSAGNTLTAVQRSAGGSTSECGANMIILNLAPTANAGPDQLIIQPGILVTLDGSASSDPNLDPLTYAWTQTGGPAVVLSNSTIVNPTFTPAVGGTYTFSLVVSDGFLSSPADTVIITVNRVPTANAGPDQFINQPAILVTLDGSGSSDGDGDPLTYAWTQTGGAAVVLSNSTIVNPTFTPAAPGVYTFQLIVNDSHIDSAADTVVITVNTVPVANAGPDQFINQPGILVTLDGSASSDGDGDPLTYAWTQTGGAAVVLSNSTIVNPTFTPATPGVYTFQLIVNDTHINSAADTVIITVNTVPVANAGPDQNVVSPGLLVTLDGSGSSDGDGDPLTYAWTQTGGAAVVLSDNTAQKPTFTPAVCGNYTFDLVVNDSHLDSAADSVLIKVNCTPVANAGPDQFFIQPGLLVTLDGSGSSDANGDPLTYAWTQTGGAAVVLSNSTIVNPTFTPAVAGVYTFQLIVNDSIIDSAPDTVVITVNTVPVANAGPDQIIAQPGLLVTLDGSASSDADGDPLTYAWTQTGGAAVVLSNSTVVGPTFTPATCGNYTFQLIVNDTHIDSAADSVSIRINCVPTANAGPDQFINQPGVLVTLDGSGSSDPDGDPLTYAWTQTGGAAVVLSNSTVVGPTFTPATPGVYTFQLIVNDGRVDSAADTVVITVNTVPVANAGPDQFINQPAVLVTLDGSGSSDGDGDPLTYAWTQTGGAAVVLSNSTIVNPTFTPATPGVYTFQLIVNDTHINSAADTVIITVNTVPVANAGPDQNIPTPGVLVTLDGSGSSDGDGDPLTYAWSQTGGAAVVLSNATVVGPTFTPATCGNYTFDLIVNDSHINSAADSVTIRVNCVPTANAGPDQFINQPGVLVTLDGSASSDPNLDPLTYAWTQTGGAAVVLSNSTVVGPTFTPATPGVYTFQLIVNDGLANSAADTVVITVNTVPVANAGPDQIIAQPGLLVTLDGSASSDGDGDPLTYAWTQTGGAAVVLSNSTVVGPTFTPATCGNYTFSLTVNDTHIDSAADSVSIRINCVPTANAGPDQFIIQPGVLVTLDGSGSSDPDGDPLTYAWTQTGGAAVVLSNSTVVGPTFTPATPGVYTFQLIVNDSRVDSAPDTVVITVNTVPVANAGPDQFIIQPGILVTLDGSASSDADGDPLTYAWTQTGGAAVVLSNSTVVGPTFTPAAPGVYTFQLVVNDTHINSAADTVIITVNTVPVANAGPDQNIPTPGVLVTLNGSGSSDGDGDPLTYAWSQTGGAAVVLSNATVVGPTFTPAVCGNYTFDLIVNDTHINSAADSVTIRVNCVPTANAGPDQFINQPGVLVTLDGSASSDPNLDPLTYAWTQTGGAAVVLSNSTVVGPTFTPAAPGVYTFQLIVNDGQADSAPDTVVITVNTVPVANAGPDQFINQPGVLVTLDGSASSDGDGDPLTYAWTQTGGAAVVLSNSTIVNPTFTPATPGVYTFQLIVNDSHIDSAADTVIITVNTVPVANAGPDQFINQPLVLVTLDGSGSSDADGDPLTYAWTQTGGAAVVLSNSTIVNPTFTPATPGVYTFQLIVNDGHIDSAADTVIITVNTVPVANAGPDQFINQPAVLVTLDGSGSSDGDGDPLTYAWTQTGGAAVVLSNSTVVGPTFTPAAPGVYTFQLVVNDTHINSAADTVVITVNTVPVANAGPDQDIPTPGVLVTLDGSGSSDADGDPLTYAWSQTGGAAVVLSNATVVGPTFTPAVCGNYTFDLIVNDTHINSAADSVTIRVNCVPTANAGPDQFIIQPGVLVTLDGSASSDPNLDPLTYAWTQTGGAAVVLSNSTVVGPTFTPAAPGVYTFQLIVNDGQADSAPDSVVITVNTVPVANAGPDQAPIQPGLLITLDGSGSSDGDGDPLTYAWSQTAGPAVVLSNATVVGPTFTPAVCGLYTFSLTVNDTHIDSAADSVNVNVNCVPVADAGPDQALAGPGVLVTLDGSGSSDGNGDPLTYAWTQTGGPAVVLSNPAAVNPTFTPAVGGVYTFQLIVNDGKIDSAPDTVVVATNFPPVADAGPDQFINQPGVLVTLDGSGSSDANGDPLTYAWTQTGGPAVVLSNSTVVGPTFTPAAPGVYTFQLIVNDGKIDSPADTVVITINTVPVANAGPDQFINQPAVLVTLDGSASSDGDGDPLTYAWTQTGGAAVVLSNSTIVNPTFTPATPGVYTFQLIVNDGHIDSAADTVIITVNTVPIADAGPDQFINQPAVLVTLDGSGSSDGDGDPLTYAWTQTGGPAVVLSNSTVVGPTFTPAVPGVYTFQLIVNDGHINSAADSVIITVNTVPVANAGPDQAPIQPGTLITLDGSGSSDGDGDPLTYAWSQTAGPAVVLSNATVVGPTFTPAVCGFYTFSLTVNDSHIDSAADSVNINVNCVPIADAGPDQSIPGPGVLVTLDGSGSSDGNGDPLTYAWTQIGGPAVVLSNSTIVNPTFTPPVGAVYTFQLIVNDGKIDSVADTVIIATNIPPVANAGPDQFINQPGLLITLDGSGSSDGNGDPLTYAWTQTGGPAVVLSNSTVVGPTFTPATPGVYTFQLIVNDGKIDSPADSVTITVNTVPVANAGPDQFINQPAVLVTLDGSGSSDGDGDPLTYAWTQTGGAAVVLSNATVVGPTFTPATPGVYTFQLIVNDGHIDSAADTVVITVNTVPVADAGVDQFLNQPGVLVTLDGSSSSDGDGDPLTFAWTQTAGPAVVLSNATIVNPTFTPALPGVYTFRLIVNDTHINSPADTVDIIVNTVPVANAGPDQAPIQPGLLITLDGSGSSDGDGDPLTYAWTQTAGPAVVLSNAAVVGPTFTPAVCGLYTFSLIVNDSHIDSAADSVNVNVNCVPVADAGPDQSIPGPGILVTLDGSGSSDGNGDPLTYAWTQTGGPAVVLSNSTIVNPTFTPPVGAIYTFQLIVNDGKIDSAPDTVVISTNIPPVADAGPDQFINQPGILVTLDGSGSSDGNGDPLTYAWTQTGGPAVVLSNATVVGPTFTPATPGVYTFQLIVNDGKIDSPADSVTITVNTVPVADAGPDQFINQPAVLVTLDGSASSDGDGDPLTYAWTQTGGAAVVLSNATVVGPTFTPAAPGVYTFQLIVNDGHIDSAADTVVITVNTVPVADAGPDQFINQPGLLVTLDGSGSSDGDGDPLTYAWTQTGGAAVVLSNATVVGPTFTPAVPGVYTFQLIVNDTHIDSAADTVVITVNTVPVANAGPDQAPIQPGLLITLDGSGSSDGDGDPLTYAWTQTAGAAVVLSNATVVGPTFTPAVCGLYTFSLTVNDSHIDSAADSVDVDVNCVPIADAGPDQFINAPGILVTLDGSGSSDADLDPLTYAWTQIGGPAVVLSNPAAVNPTFTPPSGAMYTFQLIVNDGHIDSVADTVIITTNIPPVADAGPDQFIIQPTILITLDGSGSSDANGDPLTYAWTQTGGPAVVLSNSTAVSPTFTPAVSGTYTFDLIVNDSHVDSPADTVIITVNTVPVADAGVDQFLIQPGTLVTLDGSGSSDGDGDPITYAWTQTAGAAVVLSNSTDQMPTFTPGTCGLYTFQLIVNDSYIDSPADIMNVQVNCVPVADAGPDQAFPVPGILVTLDGSGSSDADGNPLTYAWTQISGAPVVLSSTTAVNPTFTPAIGDTYVFQLIVNDGFIDSPADTVTIKINNKPVADAGPDQFIIQPTILITLDGSASSDADGDPLTYAWTQTGGAAVVLSSNTAQQPTFTPATPGTYTFQLIVNDGIVDSAADTVIITVNAVPVADAGPDQNINGLGILVTLDGSGSSDADLDPLTYSWTQIAGPAATLSSATAANPTFTTTVGGLLTFQLIVNDGHIDSPPDTVDININYPPIADAGPDQHTDQSGLLVTLDGSGSYDPEGSPITYAWTQISGPAVIALSSAVAVKPTFTPAVCGDYTFQLIVNDGLVNSTPDTVLADINCIPVADAGPDQTAASGNPQMTGWTIQLDGTGSSDADLDPLAYTWTQVAGPAAVTLSSTNSSAPTFIGAMAGLYSFQLIVNDGHIDSPSDTMDVELFAGPNPPDPLTISNAVQGQLDVSWVPPTTNVDGSPLTNLAGYYVYRSLTPGGPYTQIATIGTVNTYADTAIKPFKNYCYVLKAYTTITPPFTQPGVSLYSMEICGKALPVPYKFNKTCGNPFVSGHVVPASTPGYFNRPGGIVLDGAGFMYIADTDNNRVQKFTTACTYVSLWGGLGTTNGKFIKPVGIAYNPVNGYVYVADSYNRVQYFTTAGVFVGKLSISGVVSVSVDEATGNVLVTNNRGYVAVFSVAGVLQTTYLTKGGSASGIDMNTATNVIVGDAANDMVYIYDTAGSYIATVGTPGTDPGYLYDPFGVHGDSSGNIYVANVTNNRIEVYDSAYDVINIIGGYGLSDGLMYGPKDMDVNDADGTVYMVDQLNNRVQIFDAP